MFFKKGALKNFAIFTGTCLCQSLFLINLQAYNFIKKNTSTQEFSYEYCKIFKKVLYQILPVATFGYSKQSSIFQEITTLKFQGQHNSKSNFCRHEVLCPATKTEIHRWWFRWNFKKIQISFSKRETEEEKYAQ